MNKGDFCVLVDKSADILHDIILNHSELSVLVSHITGMICEENGLEFEGGEQLTSDQEELFVQYQNQAIRNIMFRTPAMGGF